jgi:hypothetical protein
MEWSLHPGLDQSLVPTIQQVIERIPLPHLLPLVPKEVFHTPDEAYERLQNWAFSQGFCSIIASHLKNVMIRFICKHHGDKPLNT